jgi:non-heme chloroperoxidase
LAPHKALSNPQHKHFMKRALLSLAAHALFSVAPVLTLADQDTWKDTSSHKQGFLTVDTIRLEYLDWGGSGQTVVFLAGLGNTGHIFDDIAPKFTNNFRVLALTRRGYGKSDKPQTGYDLVTLINDVRQLLDALQIERAILVGHSLGGLEAAKFAEAFPQRVHKLVYLDSAYAYAEPGTREILAQIDSITPRASSNDRTNFTALLTWFKKNRPGWNSACDSDLRYTSRMGPDGYSARSSTPEFVEPMIRKSVGDFLPDYTKITAPALAFFADHQFDRLPAQVSEARRNEAEVIVKSAKNWFRGSIQRFEKEANNSRVIELSDTDHFCFIHRADEVTRQVDIFLSDVRP